MPTAGIVYTTAGIHPCSSSIFTSSHKKHHEDDHDGDGDEHSPVCDPDPSQPIPDSGQVVEPSKTQTIISDLRSLIDNARSSGQPRALAAFGEVGLDYDRLHYCSRAVQLASFRAQLALAASLTPQLPLFLHSRAAHVDLVAALKAAFGDRLERLQRGGVVHSFTGTVSEMRELAALGLYIGVNGCSFKTAENCEVVKEIDLDRIMLETDGPWCEVRPSHEGWKYLVEKEAADVKGDGDDPSGTSTPNSSDARSKKPGKSQQKKRAPEVPERFKVVKKEKWEEGAMVKGRNEPCNIELVAKIVAGIKGVPLEAVCEAAWANTVKVFGLDGK